MDKEKSKKERTAEERAYSQFIWGMLEHDYHTIDPKLANIITGITSEGGEVADVMKTAMQYDEPMNLEKLQKELGDVLFYIRALCLYFGWSEDDLRQMNMRKLIKRCPDGFNVEDHKAGKSNV